ncbi:hypothetical protein B0H13DRAFT_1888197 [Mycena leptocephala]|nr:hypothetical protein B0H13DRAFT_1888197 [Mycena leptocephala]
MTQLSRCGLALPLDASFDCTAHTATPADIPALPNMTLAEKNKKNLRIEKSNTDSVAYTRAYERASATIAGVGALDVGAPMEPFYAYEGNEMDFMASSKDVVSAVGPLPSAESVLVLSNPVNISSAPEPKSRRKREAITRTWQWFWLKGSELRRSKWDITKWEKKCISNYETLVTEARSIRSPREAPPADKRAGRF